MARAETSESSGSDLLNLKVIIGAGFRDSCLQRHAWRCQCVSTLKKTCSVDHGESPSETCDKKTYLYISLLHLIINYNRFLFVIDLILYGNNRNMQHAPLE